MWGIAAKETWVWEGRLISPAPQGVPKMVSECWQDHIIYNLTLDLHLWHTHTFSTGTHDAATFPATLTNTKCGQGPISDISTHHTKGKKSIGNKRTANPVSLGVHKMEDSDVSGSVEGEDEFDNGGSHSDLSDGAMSYNVSDQESKDKLLHTISSSSTSKPKLKGALVKEVSCMVHQRLPY